MAENYLCSVRRHPLQGGGLFGVRGPAANTELSTKSLGFVNFRNLKSQLLIPFWIVLARGSQEGIHGVTGDWRNNNFKL